MAPSDAAGIALMRASAAVQALQSTLWRFAPQGAAAPNAGAGLVAVVYHAVGVIGGLVIFLNFARAERGWLRPIFRVVGAVFMLLGAFALVYGGLVIAGVVR